MSSPGAVLWRIIRHLGVNRLPQLVLIAVARVSLGCQERAPCSEGAEVMTPSHNAYNFHSPERAYTYSKHNRFNQAAAAVALSLQNREFRLDCAPAWQKFYQLKWKRRRSIFIVCQLHMQTFFFIYSLSFVLLLFIFSFAFAKWL